MGGIVIRRARVEEAAALTALCIRSKAHWGYDEAFMALAAPALEIAPSAIRDGRVLVAEDDEHRLVGVGAVGPTSESYGAELAHLFVDPPAMGSGVGRALFLACGRLAKAAGAARLVILADPGAASFYRKLGAVHRGKAPSDAIPGRTLPLFDYALGPMPR